MSRQGVLFKAFNILGTNRSIFNNRIGHVNFQIAPPLVMGIKNSAREHLKTLNIPEEPKRPLAPYIKFVQENRSKIVKENPNCNNKEIITKCAEMWRSMSEEAKGKYNKGYVEELEEYRIKCLKFDDMLTPEQKKALKNVDKEKAQNRQARKIRALEKETNKPKKPASPFLRYTMDQAKVSKKSYKETMVDLKGTYSQLPQEVRSKYEMGFAADKEKYEKDLKQWKLKLIEQGLAEKLKLSIDEELPKKRSAKHTKTEEKKSSTEETHKKGGSQ